MHRERASVELRHQFRRRAVGDQHAVVEDREAMAALGFVHEMRRDEDRGARIGEFEELLPEVATRFGIDRARRFVEEQQFGSWITAPASASRCFCPPLSVPASCCCRSSKWYCCDQLVDALHGLRARDVLHGGEELEVLAHA